MVETPVIEAPVDNAPSIPPHLSAEQYRELSDKADGWMKPEEASLLSYTAQVQASIRPDQRWIEIGSYEGKSTILLAGQLAIHNAGLLFTVDPHEGVVTYPTHYGPSGLLDSTRTEQTDPTLKAFEANITEAGLWPWVKNFVAKFTDCHEADNTFDLAFVDGLHDYESVKADWAHLKPMLKNGAAVIFHDYKEWEGVTRVVDAAVKAGELIGVAWAGSVGVTQYRKS